MNPVTRDSANQDNSTCANPSCNCQVKPGETYCCDSCEEQQNSDVCACGHSACQRE